MLLKRIKVLKGGVSCKAIEEPFLAPKITFQLTVLKEPFFIGLKNILIIKTTCFTVTNLWCNGKGHWMLKFLHRCPYTVNHLYNQITRQQ